MSTRADAAPRTIRNNHYVGKGSEEIRGEVFFVLYKLSVLQSTSDEGDGSDMLIPFCPKLLYLLGDVLLKTQDDVRFNCIVLCCPSTLLTMLARRQLLSEESVYDIENKDPEVKMCLQFQ
ncbi:hypothetical protein TSUD_206050 [Trifolium subterraneum]|uniref:Uncharacterized protein n=1 Tax=Trifolium subterraneum TaxID=3900 RepID=A0A2Z6MTU7_TRISU|nr:hypothetical protein TSUD_206050 [Trifolium subterraneum]